MANSENFAVNNQESLQTLARSIRLSQGEFSLIFLRCNYGVLQQQVVDSLDRLSLVKIHKVTLPSSVKTLYTTLQAQVGDEQLQALMVFGLGSITDLDKVLTSANQVREEFRKNFPFPILIWVSDSVLQKIITLATDLESWATIIEFSMTNDELVYLLRQITSDIFAGNLKPNHQNCWELEISRRDLQLRGEVLSPTDQANLEFVLGLRDRLHNKIDDALEHFHESLKFWQEDRDLERQGKLLLNIALALECKAEHNQAESQRYREECKNYLKQSLDIFEQTKSLEIVAGNISKLGEILRDLNAWDELQAIARKALKLHQIYGTPVQIAQDYGFLAEVALQQSHYNEANQLARRAVKTLAKSSEPQPHYRDYYRFILARSQCELGKVNEAIATLENIKKKSNPQCKPKLYVTILEKLRSLYFEQGKYLEAFRIKQEQIAIEHQFGFRAFIGASHLNSKRYNVNPDLVKLNLQAIVIQEIAASGRQQDVDNLIERLSRNDHKLIVIHGQSGVGKSSILKAGLIPVLQHQAIGERDTLPIAVRVYTDWVGNLRRHLVEALKTRNCIQITDICEVIDLEQTEVERFIVKQLWKNVDCNLLTILIFDQFEEFFFTFPDESKRRHFYEFLRVCLDIPFVKVILSLREDYLHYLLELERLSDFTAINNNILDKNIRYHLGRFSHKDAKAVIRSLTERAQLYLEDELIDELVNDLASEFGEVSPIELQIVGSQLQAEKIFTLEKYRQLGTKEKLVSRFLEEVIKDCGAENERCARLVLYLLTNENGTRPFKTRDELLTDLGTLDLAPKIEKLEMVLEVLVGSGLVFEVPEVPAVCYQLVHDYLVSFIRQQQAPELLAELAAAKEKQKLTEEQLRQALREKEKALRQEQQQRQRAEIAEIEALISLSQALFLSHDQLGALVAAVRAGVQLQETEVPLRTKERNVNRIQQVVTLVQERNRFEGHSNWVTSVSVSPDGKMIASASANKTVRLWGVDGSLLHILQGHRDVVWDVCFSPDRKIIASAGSDGTIRLWNRNGTFLHSWLAHSDGIFSISFRPSGNAIVSAGADKTIKFWSIKGSLLRELHGHTDRVLSVCYSPDNTIVASASADNTIKLWSTDIQDWGKHSSLLKTLQGHTASVNSVVISPDRRTIISGSDDHTIKLWSIKGILQKTLQGHTASVNKVCVSKDGRIASASSDNTVKLWSRDGKLLATFLGHTDDVHGVSFCPDNNTIVSASSDRTVRLWSRIGTKPQSLQLDDLVKCGCEWVRDYLNNNPNIRECDRYICKKMD